MNRLARELGAGRGISFGTQLPVAFRGEAPVTSVALNMAAKPAVDPRQSELIARMYAGTALAAPVAQGFAARDALMREMGDEMIAASRNAIAPRAFETQAQRITPLMRGEDPLGFGDGGGLAAHSGEGGAQGYL